MENNQIDTNALKETYVILNELNLFSKIPEEFQNYIIENKNDNYIFNFDKNVPLFEQLIDDKTKVLISYIYMKYLNKDTNNEVFLLKEVIDLLKI